MRGWNARERTCARPRSGSVEPSRGTPGSNLVELYTEMGTAFAGALRRKAKEVEPWGWIQTRKCVCSIAPTKRLAMGFTRYPLTHFVFSLALPAIVPLVLVWPAQAQDTAALAEARVLGYEGVEALEAGDFRRAEEKLAQAFQQVKVPTLALCRARALIGLGRWVEASKLLLRAQELSPEPGQREGQLAAQRQAALERAELLERIPRLRVRVVAGLPGELVQLELDGKPAPPELSQQEYHVDPGEHRIVVRRGGTEKLLVVRLAERETRTIVVPMQEKGPLRATPARSMSKDRGSVETRPRAQNVLRAAGWVSLVVGGAALGFGAMEGILAGAKKGDLERSGCVDTHCPLERADEVNSYNRTLSLATAGFVGGGATLVAGLGLLLLTPTRADPPRYTPSLALSVGQLELKGRF